MSQDTLNRAASESPPEAVYARTTVTSSANFALPKTFVGEFITLIAEGVDVYVRFGEDSGVAATTAGQSSPSSSVIQPLTAGAWLIPAGEERHYDLANMTISTTSSTGLPWIAH